MDRALPFGGRPTGDSLKSCVDGWPIQETRSSPRTCCSARFTPSSIKACILALTPPRRTGTDWGSAGTARALSQPCSRAIDPAWNDENLREIAGRIRTPLLFAHIPASTGTRVQRTIAIRSGTGVVVNAQWPPARIQGDQAGSHYASRCAGWSEAGQLRSRAPTTAIWSAKR